MRYILKHQIIRLIVLAAMVGYTTLQFRRMKDMVSLDWYLVVAIIVLGLLAIVVITSKIKIASAHLEHHRQEGNKQHGTAD
jgi:hypothetical protein